MKFAALVGLFLFAMSASTAQITITSQPVKASTPLRVLIDPGHGGEDYGAIFEQTKEAHLILELALNIKKQLAHNPLLKIELTRYTDSAVSLQDRASLANQFDIMISLHGNSSPIPTASGAEIYFEGELSPQKEQDYLFSRQKIIQGEDAQSWRTQTILDDLKRRGKRQLSLSMGKNLASTWTPEMGSIRLKPAQFYILQQSTVPSLLVEVGFLSNSKDLRKLKSSEFQVQLGHELEKALLSYKDSIDKKSAAF